MSLPWKCLVYDLMKAIFLINKDTESHNLAVVLYSFCMQASTLKISSCIAISQSCI